MQSCRNPKWTDDEFLYFIVYSANQNVACRNPTCPNDALRYFIVHNANQNVKIQMFAVGHSHSTQTAPNRGIAPPCARRGHSCAVSDRRHRLPCAAPPE